MAERFSERISHIRLTRGKFLMAGGLFLISPLSACATVDSSSTPSEERRYVEVVPHPEGTFALILPQGPFHPENGAYSALINPGVLSTPRGVVFDHPNKSLVLFQLRIFREKSAGSYFLGMTIGKPRAGVPDDMLEIFASENWMDPNLEHHMFIPWEDWKFKDPIFDYVIMTAAKRGSAKMEPSVIRPNLQYQEKLSK